MTQENALRTLKDISIHDVAIARGRIRQEAVKICKLAKKENIEVDDYIFTEEHTRLFKWFFNIEDKELENGN